MQTENQYYAELARDQDANLVEKDEVDVTISDRIRILKEVDIGSLVSNDMCDSLMGTVIQYFESLDCKSELSSTELRDLISETIIVAAYDLTFKVRQDEVENS